MSNELLEIEAEGQFDYDTYVMNGLQELGLNTHFEMIFFLSREFVERNYDSKGKGYKHLVSLAIGKLHRKYHDDIKGKGNRNNIEGYASKLDTLIDNLMSKLVNESYMQKRLTELYKWAENEKQNNTAS